jgi:phenylpropionate dioxygenase-like ring-hydroxylating dioxygenase large terminal subunit
MMGGASWHPLCLSASIEPATSAGARLLGKELVVWRDGSGLAHVWEDRCPHRGMKLSLGFVRGDHLACLYHGWQYDASGRCRFIPAHPDLDVPETIAVQSYTTREWAGIIWTTMDADAASDEEIESLEATPVRSIYVEKPLHAAVAAFSEYEFGGAQIRQLEGNLCLLKKGADQLICAFQPVSETRTGLHFVACGATSADGLRLHALAIETLRHHLEAGEPADV